MPAFVGSSVMKISDRIAAVLTEIRICDSHDLIAYKPKVYLYFTRGLYFFQIYLIGVMLR